VENSKKQNRKKQPGFFNQQEMKQKALIGNETYLLSKTALFVVICIAIACI